MQHVDTLLAGYGTAVVIGVVTRHANAKWLIDGQHKEIEYLRSRKDKPGCAQAHEDLATVEAERDALQATLDAAREDAKLSDEARRMTTKAAMKTITEMQRDLDARGEAQATLDDLRAKVRATESVLAAGGPLVPELLLEELLGAVRAALDSVPTQTGDILRVTVEGYSEHDSGVCRHSYAEGIPGKGVRQWLCTLDTGHDGDHRANTLGGKAYRTWPSVPTQTDTPACACPTNEAGDIRCHNCGERVNKRCWKCDTPRGAGPCPTQTDRNEP